MTSRFNDFANSIHSAFDPSVVVQEGSRPPVWLATLLYLIALVGLFTPGLGTVVCVLFLGSWILTKLKRFELFGSVLLLGFTVGLAWFGYENVINLKVIDEMTIIWHLAYSAFCVVTLLILMKIRQLR